MNAAFTLAAFFTLGSVSGVVNQLRPPVQSDFGGGGLQSPIYVNGLTGQAFVYVDGIILPVVGATVGKGGVFGHDVDAYAVFGLNTDQATAAAVAAAAAGVDGSTTVRFGARNYTYTAPITRSLNASGISFVGEGSSGTNETILIFPAGVNGLSFSSPGALNSAASRCQVQIRNMAIQSSGGTATGLTLGATGFQFDSLSKHVIDNVLLYGWTTAAKQINTRQVNYSNVVFRSEVASATAFHMLCDNAAGFAGDTDFFGCDFSVLNNGEVQTTTIRLENTTASGLGLAGVKFNACNIYYGGKAAVYVINQSTGTIADICLEGLTQLDGTGNAGTVGLLIENTLGGNINDVVMNGSFANAFAKSVYVNNPTGKVHGVRIVNNFLSQATDTPVAIDGAGTRGAIITNNNIYNATGTYGINLVAGRGHIVNNNTHLGANPVSGLATLIGIAVGVTDQTVVGNTGHCTTSAVVDNSGAVNKYVPAGGNIYYT